MKIIFLSDTHLKGAGDAVHEKLIRFLDRLKPRNGSDSGKANDGSITLDHLVIAGDFFDFWFGRGDTIYPGFVPVVERLAALRHSGVRISLCEGNHDFFLADYFSLKLGMDVYPEWIEGDFDGRRILVGHGDTVDRSNLKYLALRKLLRSGFFRRLQGILPLKFLWVAARISSKTSKGVPAKTDDRLSEIMYGFAREKFREGYDAVILGHCHRLILREEQYEGRQKTFATLGDWAVHDTYLVYEEGRFGLEHFPSTGTSPQPSGPAES